ncbi:MAG: hypothetical protein WAV72_30450 [Bradyrhizobium sp.]
MVRLVIEIEALVGDEHFAPISALADELVLASARGVIAVSDEIPAGARMIQNQFFNEVPTADLELKS